MPGAYTDGEMSVQTDTHIDDLLSHDRLARAQKNFTKMNTTAIVVNKHQKQQEANNEMALRGRKRIKIKE